MCLRRRRADENLWSKICGQDRTGAVGKTTDFVNCSRSGIGVRPLEDLTQLLHDIVGYRFRASQRRVEVRIGYAGGVDRGGTDGRYLCLNDDLGLVNVPPAPFRSMAGLMPSGQVPGRYAAPSMDPRDGGHGRGRNC